MFEDVSGFGAWQRFYFILEGGHLLYWNNPNEMGDKVSLFSYVCMQCASFLLIIVFLSSLLPASRWQSLSLWLLQCQACGARVLRTATHL